MNCTCSRTFLRQIAVSNIVSGCRSTATRRAGRYLPSNRVQLRHYATPSRLIEEETLPNYDRSKYYPVYIGSTLNEQYRVVGKLGFGSSSTTWLCHDQRTGDYVTVKVFIRTSPLIVNREERAYRYISKASSSHPGSENIRLLRDHFYLPGLDKQQHLCLVHQPMHLSIFDIWKRIGGGPMPEELVKRSMRSLMSALDFLHSEVSITHGDIKMSNLMIPVRDPAVFSEFEDGEKSNPSPRKVVDDERTIYTSRKFATPTPDPNAIPLLCDFGEARKSFSSTLLMQPERYRSPEVLLRTELNPSIDIWNAACVAWYMTEGKRLYEGFDDGRHNNQRHVAEIASSLGDPPLELQDRSPESWKFFDSGGKWKGSPRLPHTSLEQRITSVQGKSKEVFLRFVESMLRWLPEERKSARELLQEPWLSKDPL